ncbi:MAG TPA: hypothetical protein VM534_10355 [Thermoanaerobaculia bacterium]|nr:hypothetical protein [Thermoanaerobaculia bacterium]
MSLIDWSDPDEMLGLLVDYVADEANRSHADRERRRFLRALSRDLGELADEASGSVREVAKALREIRASQPKEFVADPVIEHLDACIEELHRIESVHDGSIRP